MTGTNSEEAGVNGVLRLTWITDHLAHVLEQSQANEPTGTWTGLACPDHGLEIGADDETLQHLPQGDIADLIWEAPLDFTAEHGHLCQNAIGAYRAGNPE